MLPKKKKTKGQIKKERQSRRPKFGKGLALCSSVFFSDASGEYVDLKTVCDPEYSPYLRFRARSRQGQREYTFVYHSNGKLWLMRTGVRPAILTKVKHNRKEFKNLIEDVLDEIPIVWSNRIDTAAILSGIKNLKITTVKPSGCAPIWPQHSSIHMRHSAIFYRPKYGVSSRGIGKIKPKIK